MEFGVALPNFPFGALPTKEHLLEVARTAEAEGYTSVWASDHLLVGPDFPRYGTIFECLSTLAWVAAKTERVRVGSSVLVLPMRHAVVAAKQAATIDNLTGGRLILGVGAGWNEGEFERLGAPFKSRGRVFDESLEVMRRLWTVETPSFSGEFYSFGDSLFFPKPAARRGPPLWIGGGSDKALRRAARLGDGWHADEVLPDDFRTKLETLRRYAGDAGRSVASSIRYTVDLFTATGAKRAGERASGPATAIATEVGMKGDFGSMIDWVCRYRDLGATDFICQFEHDTAAQHVDFVRTFAREVVKKVG